MPKFVVNNVKLLCSQSYNLNSNTDCTICRSNLNLTSLYNLEDGKQSVITLGVCGHYFHDDCINLWINKHSHCPICYNKWIKRHCLNNDLLNILR